MKNNLFSRRDFLKFTGVGAAALLSSGFIPPRQILHQPVPCRRKLKWVSLCPTPRFPSRPRKNGCRSCRERRRACGATKESCSAAPASPFRTARQLPGPHPARQERHEGAHLSSTTTSPRTASSTRTACACRRTATGSPCRPSGPAQTKVYEFQVIDRACPAWFHPHPHMRTAEQVYMGHGRPVLRHG